MMNVPDASALVENMSYVACPKCGEQIPTLFGESHIDSIAQKHGISAIAKLPIDPKLAAACDRGVIELFEGNCAGRTVKGNYKITGSFIFPA